MVTPVDARRVQALIEFASHHYRYTILDLPRSDAVVLDALGGVGSIVVVVNQDLATLRSARAIAGAMRQRYGKEKVRVVLSRPDSGSEIDREDVEEAIGERLAFTFPSDHRASIQALNRGKPVALHGEGKLADALRRFTTELTGLKADAAPHPEERTMRLLPRLALVRSLLS
jgi:Flp pilus assembly CpaE family ATPase